MLPGHNAASFSLRSHQGPLHSNESRTNNHLFPLKTLPTQAPFFCPLSPCVHRNHLLQLAGLVEKNSNGPILRDDANQLFFNHRSWRKYAHYAL